MNMFAVFQERAQASMRDAMSTATELASSAMEYGKVMSDTVAQDMKVLAQDAREKAKALTDDNEKVQAPTGPRPRDVGINERLIGAVQSLSYASFADRESSASNGDEEQGESTLAQWQLQHAQLILKECPELESLRFALCPKRMSEQQFWTTYFLLVNDVLDKGGTSAAGTPGNDDSPGFSNDGGKSTAAPSALTAWEDVQPDDAASAPSPNITAEPGDDLDRYLQDMLDGDGAGAHDHVGTSEGGDLDEYLKELDGDGAAEGGTGTGVDFGDVDNYLGELNLSDDEAAKGDAVVGDLDIEATSTPEKTKSTPEKATSTPEKTPEKPSDASK